LAGTVGTAGGNGLQVGHGGSGSVAMSAVGSEITANKTTAARYFGSLFTVVKVLSKVEYTVIMSQRIGLGLGYVRNFLVPKM
jgi:hypothetical protein